MSYYVGALNDFAHAWAAVMWRACWQGGLVIVIVWALCRAWPKLPQSLCCWLWRLAYLKLVLLLIWITPIALPLLPDRLSSFDASRQHARNGAPSSATHDARLDKTAAGVLAAKQPKGSISLIAPDSPSQYSVAANIKGAKPWPSGAAVLLFVWLAGVSWCGRQVWRKWCLTRALRGSCRPVRDGALLTLYEAVLRQFQVRRPPQLMTTSGTGSPLLIGLAQPVIVLPDALIMNCTAAELRLMLAHELAHFKRRDLLWNCLFSVAHGLFFFHPALWFVQAQWRLAQEMACDELVLKTGDTPARDYGRMLLKVAAQGLPRMRGQVGTVAVVESYATLERRLAALQSFVPQRTRLAASAVLAVVGMAAIVPVRLTGQEQKRPASHSHTPAAKAARPVKVQSKTPQKSRAASRIVRTQLAGTRLTGSQNNSVKFDPKEGYYLASVADGLGRITYLSLLLSPDAAVIKELGFWPDDNKILHATLPRLRTGWGINIGDKPRQVQHKIGAAPNVSSYDRRRDVRVYIYKAPIFLTVEGAQQKWQYTGKYTFHNERLRSIHYSAQSLDSK